MKEKSLVEGINSIKDKEERSIIEKEIREELKEEADKALKGIELVSFPKNLTPQSGFFAILDFTKIKGMKYNGRIIFI